MTDVIRGPVPNGEAWERISALALGPLDSTNAAHPHIAKLVQAVVNHARSAGERLTPLELRIEWPVGVPEDARATLRAQLAGELQRLTLDALREVNAACAGGALDGHRITAAIARQPGKRR